MEKLWSHEKQLQFLNNLKNFSKASKLSRWWTTEERKHLNEHIWQPEKGTGKQFQDPFAFYNNIKRLSSKNKNEVWFFWGFVIILLQYILFVIYKSFLNALAIFLTIYHSNVLIPPYLSLVVTNVVALFYKKEQKIYEKILDGSIIFEENTSKWTKNTPMCPN